MDIHVGEKKVVSDVIKTAKTNYFTDKVMECDNDEKLYNELFVISKAERELQYYLLLQPLLAPLKNCLNSSSPKYQKFKKSWMKMRQPSDKPLHTKKQSCH